MALLALSLSALGPVATTSAEHEMDMTPAPQSTIAIPLCQPTLDFAGPSLATSTVAGPGESTLLSLPVNPLSLKQAAHSSASEVFPEAGNTFTSPLNEPVEGTAFAFGAPAVNGVGRKPAGSTPKAGTIESQPATGTVPRKNTFDPAHFLANTAPLSAATPLSALFQNEAFAPSPFGLHHRGSATDGSSGGFGFAALPAKGQPPSINNFRLAFRPPATFGPFKFNSQASAPSTISDSAKQTVPVIPGQRVWFTSKLVLGAFRVAHLSRLLPYNSSTALGMLLEHRRDPWVVYKVTDTGPDSDSEILLMPLSRPSTVPPPADVRRDIPDNAHPEPHVKLHLHRDDFHLFEVSTCNARLLTALPIK